MKKWWKKWLKVQWRIPKGILQMRSIYMVWKTFLWVRWRLLTEIWKICTIQTKMPLRQFIRQMITVIPSKGVTGPKQETKLQSVMCMNGNTGIPIQEKRFPKRNGRLMTESLLQSRFGLRISPIGLPPV